MSLSSPELDAKYRRLCLKPAALGLELVIGNVQLSAAEHTWRVPAKCPCLSEELAAGCPHRYQLPCGEHFVLRSRSE
jgi:hypothetical protein